MCVCVATHLRNNNQKLRVCDAPLYMDSSKSSKNDNPTGVSGTGDMPLNSPRQSSATARSAAGLRATPGGLERRAVDWAAAAAAATCAAAEHGTVTPSAAVAPVAVSIAASRAEFRPVPSGARCWRRVGSQEAAFRYGIDSMRVCGAATDGAADGANAGMGGARAGAAIAPETLPASGAGVTADDDGQNTDTKFDDGGGCPGFDAKAAQAPCAVRGAAVASPDPTSCVGFDCRAAADARNPGDAPTACTDGRAADVAQNDGETGAPGSVRKLSTDDCDMDSMEGGTDLGGDLNTTAVEAVAVAVAVAVAAPAPTPAPAPAPASAAQDADGDGDGDATRWRCEGRVRSLVDRRTLGPSPGEELAAA